MTATDTLSYAASAERACRAAIAAATLVATPTLATVHAVHAALADARPLALLHHRLPPAELARQRELVDRAQRPADTAFVLFTSGSTGEPRGVVLSRAAISAAAAASAAHLAWRDDDRWLLALSLAHTGGLAVVVRCLAARKPVVLLDGDFEATRCAALLRDHAVTLASLVPTQLAALLEVPAWRPPRQLRAVLLGGAATPPALLDAALARGVPILQTYGATAGDVRPGRDRAQRPRRAACRAARGRDLRSRHFAMPPSPRRSASPGRDARAALPRRARRSRHTSYYTPDLGWFDPASRTLRASPGVATP